MPGWPFSNVVQPNIDSDWVTMTNGYVAVPTTAAGALWILGLFVTNPTAAEIAFSLKDANGKVICPGVSIPAGSATPIEVPFMPVVGALQWKGDANGLVSKLWGYQ